MKNSDKILVITVIVIVIMILNLMLIFINLDKTTLQFFALGAVLSNVGAIFIIYDVIKK